MSKENEDKNYRTLIYFVKPGKENFEPAQEICSNCRAIHNLSHFEQRQIYFKYRDAKKLNPDVKFGEFSISKDALCQKLRQEHPRTFEKCISSAIAQRTVYRSKDEFNTFSKQVKAQEKDPSNNPKQIGLPGYARKYHTCFIATNGFCVKDGFIHISGAEKIGLQPIPVPPFCKDQEFNPKTGTAIVNEVRFVPFSNGFKIEVVYDLDKVEAKPQNNLDEDTFLSLDLGVKNTVTGVTNKNGESPIIFRGGDIKSINQGYNKNAAKLRSCADTNKARSIGKCRHLKVITAKRYWRLHALLHNMSCEIVDYCVERGIGKIIIGHNAGWKQGINLGKRNNQNFVCIPFNKLIHLITYKAEWQGIEVIVREESYTSKADALAFDPIPTYGVNDSNVSFSGKRIHRGLYQSSTGVVLNADVNGAINIARKELGDDWLKELVGRYRGCLVNTPVVMNRKIKTTRKSS